MDVCKDNYLEVGMKLKINDKITIVEYIHSTGIVKLKMGTKEIWMSDSLIELYKDN